MNFYTMTIVIAIIIAICYLATLYVSVRRYGIDKNIPTKILCALIDIRRSLWDIEKKIKDERPKPTKD